MLGPTYTFSDSRLILLFMHQHTTQDINEYRCQVTSPLQSSMPYQSAHTITSFHIQVKRAQIRRKHLDTVQDAQKQYYDIGKFELMRVHCIVFLFPCCALNTKRITEKS